MVQLLHPSGVEICASSEQEQVREGPHAERNQSLTRPKHRAVSVSALGLARMLWKPSAVIAAVSSDGYYVRVVIHL